MARPAPEHPEVRLVVSARSRGPSLVDPFPRVDAEDPDDRAILRAVAAFPEAWAWTLSGGEPTTRSDLPALIATLAANRAPRLGLATDGLALVHRPVVDGLVAAGLRRVRIPLHSGRAEAHDWLVCTTGAAWRVRRAIVTCREAGLLVEVDTVVTRPTLPHLDETMGLLGALGVACVHLHRPLLHGTLREHSVAITPRLAMLPGPLVAAVLVARRGGLRVAVHGFPRCAAPRVARHEALPGTERWVFPDDEAWRPAIDALSVSVAARCDGCPHDCPGAPADYVERFGNAELARGGRSEPGGVVDVLLERTESTRVARSRLVDAMRERPRTVRLVGDWDVHPGAERLGEEARLLEELGIEVVFSPARRG